ncbi:DUF3302 domain-containing protein [Cupriavidus taiwanensis]|uniref:DUF3302 domain-containing protein n=1 Tax=Cupriavidus taiwanensis TaxID=164546 RepID=A0A375GXI2_9BURK|nr:DUF3302 domain-containing protein [Cupriavidus taiwanensis]SOY56601.1 conserved exported hypothetical protein [Cupriavidus taiwanensis]SOY57357.1 conserved exported hypothetical protein [Cupriavidus taiwanensis]SOY79364.1 conserved exported hypothetical protein [Cupriavidus taiwanensis]SOZ65272.1 conserved exported hypothetical protein [Cupriavidus taiwanensis]SOZ76518.1 conserved exported hypothetical protein [Cupriavidus taiwanensis]
MSNTEPSRSIPNIPMKLRQSLLTGAWLLAMSEPARASLLSGKALESAANAISWVVLILVPLAGLYLFWMLHVWPEKVAQRKQHPQKEAIHALCLLSLFFGGLLWPMAWLWAHTKPVFYRAAYGTDKAPQDDAARSGAGERN